MTTMFTDIPAARTAEGEPLTPWFALNMWANDWSVFSGSVGLEFPEASRNDAAGGWRTMTSFCWEIPTYTLDVSYDDLEVVFTVRLETKVDAGRDTEIRLADAGHATSTFYSNEHTVGATGAYVWTEDMTIVYPLASLPTGRHEIWVHGQFTSGSDAADYLYVRRHSTESDCEVFVRPVP